MDREPREGTGSAIEGPILAARPHQVAENGIDLCLPALAAEDTVMADAGLQMVALARRRQACAEPMGCGGLADGADVVALALHRQQPCVLAPGEVDAAAALGEP